MVFPVNRRQWLAAALGLIGSCLPFPRTSFGARQSVDANHRRFLARALVLAQRGSAAGDGTAYGAVITLNGEIISEAWNRTHVKHDPTAHAEIEAIRDACHRLGRRSLHTCVLYTNGGRPCPMCETAAYYADISTIVYGDDPDSTFVSGAPRFGGC